MLTSQATSKGAITYSKNVIEQITDRAFEPLKGRMWQANYKGNMSEVLMKLQMDALKQLKMEMTDKGVFLQVFVMAKLGESIGDCSRRVIKSIAEDITRQLELPIDDIVVTLTGVITAGGKVGKRLQNVSYREQKLAGRL